MRKRLSRRSSARNFKHGATHTKAVNISAKTMRGGISF